MAAILVQMDAGARAAALGEIEAHDPALARLVRERMFTFEDMGKLDAKSLSTLLRAVDRNDLALGLRGLEAERNNFV